MNCGRRARSTPTGPDRRRRERTGPRSLSSLQWKWRRSATRCSCSLHADMRAVITRRQLSDQKRTSTLRLLALPDVGIGVRDKRPRSAAKSLQRVIRTASISSSVGVCRGCSPSQGELRRHSRRPEHPAGVESECWLLMDSARRPQPLSAVYQRADASSRELAVPVPQGRARERLQRFVVPW